MEEITQIQEKIKQSGQSMNPQEKAELDNIMKAAFDKSYAIDAQIRRLDRPNASLADVHQQMLNADKILNEAHAKFFPKTPENEQQKILDLAAGAGLPEKSLSRVKTVIDNANKKYQSAIDEINNSSNSEAEKEALRKAAKEKQK